MTDAKIRAAVQAMLDKYASPSLVAARLGGVSERTVQNWADGKIPKVPRSRAKCIARVEAWLTQRERTR